jgi:hypothetical protein
MAATTFLPAVRHLPRLPEAMRRHPRASTALLLIPLALIAGGWVPDHPAGFAAAAAAMLAFAALAVARPWVACWVYLGILVLSPNYVGFSLGSFGDWTLTRALGLAVAAALVYRKGIRLADWNAVDWGFALYLVATTLPNLLKGVTIVYSVKLLFWAGLDYGVPYLVLRSAGSLLADRRRALRICAFWAIVIAAFAVAEVASGTNLFTDVGPQLSVAPLWSEAVYRADALRARVGFGHPISLGMYAALMLPLMVWLIRWSRGWQRGFAIFAAFAVSATLLTTLSRGPWVGALVALVLTVALQPGHARTSSIVAFATIMVGVGIVYVSGATPLTQLVNDSFNPATDAYGNIVYRQNLIDMVLPVWRASPVIGYADYLADGAFPTTFSIDNHYLATLIVQGAMGLVAFLVVIAAALWACWSTLRERGNGAAERALAATLLAALVGQLVVLGTVAMVGLGPQVFWGFVGFCAGAWSSYRPAHIE